jgi:uncharacterized protein YndB with AHSA1/START domain
VTEPVTEPVAEPVAVERQIPFDAAPVQVAAALARSPWREALRIEPAGSGSRVVLTALIEPRGLAEAIERLVVDDLGRLRSSLCGPSAATGPTDRGCVPSIDHPTERVSDQRKEDRTMNEIRLSIVVDATPEEVWPALADFGGVATWNPGVKESHLTSEATQGVGTSRQCRLAPMGIVRERVTEWDPGRMLAIEIYENENIPGFRSAVATLRLAERGPSATEVSVEMAYSVGLGLVGATANALGMRRLFNRSLSRLLAGLKYHVETGRPVDGDAGLDLGAVVVAG